MMVERIFVCTSEARYLSVLAAVEPYVESVEGPTDWDPGYLLTLNVPLGEWDRIMKVLRN